MKHFLLPLLLLAACAPEPLEPERIELHVEAVSAGDAFRWSAGDCIFVNGQVSNPLEAEAAGGVSAVFTLKKEVEGECRALFPASALSVWRETSSTLMLPGTQYYRPEGPDPAAFLLMGSGEAQSLVLSPAVAFVSITVTGGYTLSRLTLKSQNKSRHLSGRCSTDFRNISPLSGQSYAEVSMVARSGAPGGSTFVFCVPPGDFGDGLQCLISDADGGSMSQTLYPRTPFSPGQTAVFEVEYVPGTDIDPEPPAAETAELTVATVNLLKPSGRCEEMSLGLNTVRDALRRSIEQTGADLLAFNEVDENYIPGGAYDVSALCGNLPDTWRWSMEWPNDIEQGAPLSYSYANGFAYNSAVLRLEESGYVWLSKASETWYAHSSRAYKNAGSPERTCIRARFTHIASGRRFWFFVTHLPTESQGGGANMAGGVNGYAQAVAGTLPRILAGDMNSGPGGTNQTPYARLRTLWADAWESVGAAGNLGIYETYDGTLSGSSANYYYNYELFTRNRPDRRIDHLFCAGAMHAASYRTVAATYRVGRNFWCPSDHLPVVARFIFD